MMNKDNIVQRYSQNTLDETRETLVNVLRITSQFKDYGYDRLLAMLDLRQRKESEILNLIKYLYDALGKMKSELIRAEVYKESYNKEYATEINGYYQELHEVFKKIRSHMSPFKTLMQKGQKGIHSYIADCEKYGVEPKSMMDTSVMGNAPFTYALFPIAEQPACIQQLYHILESFFEAIQKCMELCIEMINEETNIRKDPSRSYALFNEAREKAWKDILDEVLLITDSTIDTLKRINPVYQDSLKFSSERDFAPNGFHVYTKIALRHYNEIKCYEAQQKGYTGLELAIWDDQLDVIDNVRMVVKEFDNLLPESFEQRNMGQYMYYFCQWACAKKTKKVCEYFIQNYKGKYKPSQYPAVNNHHKTFNEKAIEYRKFIENISFLTTSHVKTDWKKELSILLNS